MRKTLTFNDMGINLTSELIEIGLIELIEQSHVNWRLALYEAIKSSDTDKVFTLVNSAPKKVDSSVLIDMKKELVKIVPVSVLLERIEEFNTVDCYQKIKAAFEILERRNIHQFTITGINDDYPCLLDVWAGSNWRPEETDSDNQTFFVLGECFSEYYNILGEVSK